MSIIKTKATLISFPIELLKAALLEMTVSHACKVSQHEVLARWLPKYWNGVGELKMLHNSMPSQLTY